jgi:anthranilate synthase/aminodeoxychorismate synthase-like glutamine amidotransferase
MVVILDSFDSFTYNLAHGLTAAGAQVRVLRVDQADLDALAADPPELLVLSPGPGRPEDAAVPLEAIRRFAGRIPLFGVCLGMQCLAVAFGGTVGPAPAPVHGRTSLVFHDGRGLFQGVTCPLRVGRYHSLCVLEAPPCMAITAWTEDGVAMAMRHRNFPITSLQFHPESFLTDEGAAIMAHVVRGDY